MGDDLTTDLARSPRTSGWKTPGGRGRRSPGHVTQISDGVAKAYEEKFGTPGFEVRARRKDRPKPERKPKVARAV